MHTRVAHGLHIGGLEDAGLGHQQAVGGHVLEHAQGRIERDLERPQVAVVDAHQRGLELEGALQLGAVVHFYQHRHVQAAGDGFKVGHLRVIQTRGDQQNGIGPHGPRFIDLVRIHHEILAQHGQQCAGPGLLQVVRLALEKLPIGQHRQASRAHLAVAFHVALGNVGRLEVGAQHALAGAGLLDLGNHRRLTLGDLGAQRAFKVAGEHAALGIGAHGGQRQALFGGGHFFVLDGDDFVEDVTHGLQPSCRAPQSPVSVCW